MKDIGIFLLKSIVIFLITIVMGIFFMMTGVGIYLLMIGIGIFLLVMIIASAFGLSSDYEVDDFWSD